MPSLIDLTADKMPASERPPTHPSSPQQAGLVRVSGVGGLADSSL